MTKSRQLSGDVVRFIGIATHIVNLDGSPWDQWMVGAYSPRGTSLYDRPEIKTKGVGELWFGKATDREEAADVIGLLVEKGCLLDDRSDPTGHMLYFVRQKKKRSVSNAQKPYSSVDHVREAGLKVVADVVRGKSVTKRAADRGGKPEHLIRAALRAVLPEWIGVEPGFVIDSYGHTSLQQDIVLFEREHSPVFRTAAAGAGAGNFPCECVIAAGEVKASTYRGWAQDVFQKSASAKRMRRAIRDETVAGNRWLPWRHYGTRATATEQHARGVIFDQDRYRHDRIMTFGVAVESGLKPSTIARQVAKQLDAQEHALGPDTIVILQRGVVEGIRTVRESDRASRTEIFGLQNDRVEETSMQEWNNETKLWDPFSYLVTMILEHAYTGRTTHEAALLGYMTRTGTVMAGFRGVTHPIGRKKRL